jgi:hypothetical protein
MDTIKINWEWLLPEGFDMRYNTTYKYKKVSVTEKIDAEWDLYASLWAFFVGGV